WLTARMTVARRLDREGVQQCYRAGTPIGLHEFLYPLVQEYESVAVRADVELGGTDQTFNLLVGRDLQRDAGQAGQVAMVLPLLEGTDGVQKMSKSLGNHIGIAEPPEEMYGKVMSLRDALMLRYYDLLSPADAERREGVRPGRVYPRLVAQGAVKVDGRPVGIDYRFRRGRDRLLAVGSRRLAEISFEEPNPPEGCS